MIYRVVYRPKAAEDLDAIYDWIADFAGAESAKAIIDKIEARCAALDRYPERCAPRPELGSGIRTAVEGKAVIAIRIDGDEVLIVRVRYGGQRLLAEDMR